AAYATVTVRSARFGTVSRYEATYRWSFAAAARPANWSRAASAGSAVGVESSVGGGALPPQPPRPSASTEASTAAVDCVHATHRIDHTLLILTGNLAPSWDRLPTKHRRG